MSMESMKSPYEMPAYVQLVGNFDKSAMPRYYEAEIDSSYYCLFNVDKKTDELI